MYNTPFIKWRRLVRPSGRISEQLREIKLTRDYTCHAEGSVLVEFGKTKIICTISVENGVPHFLKGKQQGWLTAEYGMLPRSTHSRSRREATKNNQSGRTMEIQRLIGRSLRAAIDLKKLGDRTMIVDCDVIQADGGTRTASITGAYVALIDAIRSLQYKKALDHDPLIHAIASVSVGIYQGTAVLDLDYAEDVKAETDMNVVMNSEGQFIEVQGTAEGAAFSHEELNDMLALAKKGINELFEYQQQALAQ